MMTMRNELTPKFARKLRGQILILLRGRHNMQGHRLDDIELARALQSLTFEVGINEVVTIVQDLEDRGYVRFRSRHNSLTGRVYLDKIELTAAGRDQVEENVTIDPAVEF